MTMSYTGLMQSLNTSNQLQLVITFSLNIFYCKILYSNGVGSQVLTTLVTTLPLITFNVWPDLGPNCLKELSADDNSI